MEAFITGIGWVSKASMGYNGNMKYFDQKSSLPQINGKDILSHPYKHFGRMDGFSKLGFAAISFAMKDAGIKTTSGNIESEKISPAKKDISMIASTVTGCLETDSDFQKTLLRPLPSPALFAYTLDSSFLGEASIYFGLTGESFVINEEKPDGLKGLFLALEIMDSGVSDMVLCGVCNSDIQTNKPYYSGTSAGSLFFVLQKKCLLSYGTIESSSLENYYYQKDIKITSLHELAQKCTEHNKVQTDKSEYYKD